jgi:arabinose-5-phosphate isomerase
MSTQPHKSATGSAHDSEVADLAAARQVLETEADALALAARLLNGSFSKAVDLLFATRGRVIISGLGKSGHVARKIAATLASTGTPAQFVHPNEASHGDLGMVTAADALLMLSNSGETSELSDLVVHAKRNGIAIVAMTGGAASTLAAEADCVLLLPGAPEACPMGLAPTTSTTVMLALGDALAVALMGRRGFSKDDFRVLHPGGSLGQALMRVGDIMHDGAELPLVKLDAPMSEVLVVMTSKSFGCAGVVDNTGVLVGIITDGDVRRHMAPGLLSEKAADVMTKGPATISRVALVAEAVHEMNAGRRAITCLFVTEDRRPIGIVHIHDCLRTGTS